MKKSNLQDVECPNCHAHQGEPIGAISTNCKKCGKYFKLGAKHEHRSGSGTRAPKDNREVYCVKCGAPNIVSATALSTQCIRCLHYLELGDKIVKGVQTGKIYAYDDLIFAEGSSFKGMEATGRRMEVRGKVFSKLRANEEIIAMAGSHISGEIKALVIRVERGATVKVQALECARLLVSGEVEISGTLTASEIVLSDGATFAGKLHIPGSKLKAEAGVNAQFDSIICDEMTVEGNVTLAVSLDAEKTTVLSGGVLTAPVIRSARIEVNPGGTLQARIEKYVPREKPEPEAEPAPQSNDEDQAEAA